MHLQTLSHPAEALSSCPTAISIGVFDAMHLGHQNLIQRLTAEASKRKLSPVLWTFSQNPPGKDRKRIHPPQESQAFLKALGLESIYTVPFNPAFSEMSADVFLQDILMDRLQCRFILLGQEARLGKNRSTSASEFINMARQKGLEGECHDLWLDDQHRKISTRLIKVAIASGDFATVESALGRAYYLSGSVFADQGKGRSLGFPTANISLKDLIHPPLGVYLSEVVLPDDSTLAAISYIGSRPTLNQTDPTPVLETHIPGWQGDLYGLWLKVRLLRFLRPQIKFASVAELKQQILIDLQAVPVIVPH